MNICADTELTKLLNRNYDPILSGAITRHSLQIFPCDIPVHCHLYDIVYCECIQGRRIHIVCGVFYNGFSVWPR